MSLKSRVALAVALAVAAIALAIPAAASAFGPDLSFSSFGSEAGQLSGPGDAAVAPDSSVYVSDFSNRRIDVFSADGAFLFAFGKDVAADGSEADVCTAATGCKVGSVDNSAGAISAPEGVAIGSGGRIYISDLGGNRVDVFGLDGQFRFAFGKAVNALPAAAEPDICTAVTGCKEGAASAAAGGFDEVKGIGIGPEGNVYVADRRNNRIDAFDSEGRFLFAFGKDVIDPGAGDVCTAATGCKAGSAGAGAGEVREPFDVKAGPDGAVLVAAPLNNRIDVFDARGAFQRAFGKGVNAGDGTDTCSTSCKAGAAAGTGAIRAAAIEIDAAGTVFAVESSNNRLSEFTSAGQFVRTYGEGVLDGAEAFQVCLPSNECKAGKKEGKAAGAITGALGVALDCRRGVYAVEHFTDRSTGTPVGFARVERFAGPSPVAGCPPSGEGPTEGGKPSNKFSFGRLRLNRERGTATLAVRLPGPGTLVLKGAGIRTVRAAVKRAGTVRLMIKPAGAAKRRLLKTAKATVRARITFTPKGGVPRTKQRPLTLRAALGR